MKKKVNETEYDVQKPEDIKKLPQLKDKDTVIVGKKTGVGSGTYPTSTVSSTSMAKQMEENEIQETAGVEPQAIPDIKYLSNIKDANTGEVSKPFTIAAKNYQMVRGTMPNGEVVMAVYCHDDMNDNGENIIHPVEYFEENIVKPYMESMNKLDKEPVMEKPIEKVEDRGVGSIGLGEYKYFLVNEKTGKFRKFKTVQEIAKAIATEDEKFMNLKELKKYFESRVFGGRNKHADMLSEVTPTGQESDEEMSIKAKKIMAMIAKRIPPNIMKTISTQIAQTEVIAAFAEMIGVPRQGLSSLISSLKDISVNKDAQPAQQAQQAQPAQQAQQAQPAQKPVTESKIITKSDLDNEIGKKRVIKKLKVKDIK